MPCLMQLRFRVVLSVITCELDARCHLANRGLEGNDKMEVRGNRTRKLLRFSEGQMSKTHAAGHFPCHCSTKCQCNYEEKDSFLKP